MKEVTITIRPDGTVELETHGFTGESCVEVSKAFEKALIGNDDTGGHVQRRLKSDYYQREQQDNDVQDGLA